jgi:hypothetical protein
MKHIIPFLFLLVSATPVLAQTTETDKSIVVNPAVGLQTMNWLEHSVVANASVGVDIKACAKLNFAVHAGIFTSFGDSPNAIQNASLNAALQDKYGMNAYIPSMGEAVKSTYKGGFLSVDAGVPFKLSDSVNITVEPFVGIEGKFWNRSLDYGKEGAPLMVEEQYKFLSPALGAKVSYTTKSKVKLTLRLSTSYPVISKIKFDDKNLGIPAGDLDMRKQLSQSLELGAKIKKLTLKLRYERINIGGSDSLKNFATPPSRANVTGISIGYDF